MIPQYDIRFGDWSVLDKDAKTIRFEVFVEEQKVPAELEMDHMDAVCLHAVAYDGAGTPIGTGRLLPDGHIGRIDEFFEAGIAHINMRHTFA